MTVEVETASKDDSLEEGLSEDVAAYGVRIYCIVGLGNPGVRYDSTPHNVGFSVITELSKRHKIPLLKNEGVALTGTGKVNRKDVLLAKPQTFMNNSGTAVKAIMKSRTLTNRDLIVIHDELDLPWTALRIKKKGSAAGHNGVKSVIASLGSDYFTRVRVGVRPDQLMDDPTLYLLAPWARDRKEDVSEMVSYTADAVEAIVAEGAIRAMTKFNRRARGLQEEEE